MQRNSAHQNFVRYLLITLLYAGYVSLTSIYLFLPPLISIVMLLFYRSLQKQDSLLLIFLIISILILEAQKGFLGFTLLIYFLLAYRYILPKLDKSINAKKLKNFFYIVVAYIGYYLFSTLLAQIFLLPSFSLDWYVVYYIVIEYFIVSLFLWE